MKKTIQTARWAVGMILIFSWTGIQAQDLKELASAGWDSTVIDSNTKKIIFNDETGEVTGCDLIKYIGEVSFKDDFTRQREINARVKCIFNKIGKEIRSQMDNNIEGGILSPDGRFLVCFKEYDDGIQSLWFFDSSGIYLNHYVFEKPQICYLDFNAASTYFMATGSFDGNFYFFTSNGVLTRKGNIHELIPESTTSYGRSNISADGKIWLLSNSKTYLFDEKGGLIDILGGSNATYIDSKIRSVVFSLSNYILIYNYQTKKLSYLSFKSKNNFFIDFSRLKLLNNSKTGYYEYKVF